MHTHTHTHTHAPSLSLSVPVRVGECVRACRANGRGDLYSRYGWFALVRSASGGGADGAWAGVLRRCAGPPKHVAAARGRWRRGRRARRRPRASLLGHLAPPPPLRPRRRHPPQRWPRRQRRTAVVLIVTRRHKQDCLVVVLGSLVRTAPCRSTCVGACTLVGGRGAAPCADGLSQRRKVGPVRTHCVGIPPHRTRVTQ
jgi:hypothetical protein